MDLTFASKRLVGSKTRLLRETPCKFIEDERSLVATMSRGKCVEDELPNRQSPVNQKVPLRGTCSIQYCDQAANLSEVLAWSLSLKSVLRTANISDVFPWTLIRQVRISPAGPVCSTPADVIKY